MSTYKNLNIIHDLTIFGTNRVFRNLSDILYTKIENISNLESSMYSSMGEHTLITLLNKYLKLGKDYVMDLTVELIDAVFADQV